MATGLRAIPTVAIGSDGTIVLNVPVSREDAAAIAGDDSDGVRLPLQYDTAMQLSAAIEAVALVVDAARRGFVVPSTRD